MANEFTYSINTVLEGDILGQYSKGLGELTVQAPQLLERSAQQQRQALAQSQRTGLASMAEQAAQARADAKAAAGPPRTLRQRVLSEPQDWSRGASSSSCS